MKYSTPFFLTDLLYYAVGVRHLVNFPVPSSPGLQRKRENIFGAHVIRTETKKTIILIRLARRRSGMSETDAEIHCAYDISL